ncbi:hypothetical protein [Chlamydia vaughanii]|uniref:hypothetical protein n=1 Tax=Chlamydia vaughanii TaxID=3112552 RepID=UPI0032B2CAE5
MTISSVESAAYVPVAEHHFVFKPVSCCSWVATIVTVLAGLLLFILEIGFLIAFALPSSVFLSVIVSLVTVASAVLFWMAIKQLINKFFKPIVADTAVRLIQLKVGIQEIKSALAELRIQLEKVRLAQGSTEKELNVVYQRILDLELQLNEAEFRLAREELSLGPIESKKVSEGQLETQARIMLASLDILVRQKDLLGIVVKCLSSKDKNLLTDMSKTKAGFFDLKKKLPLMETSVQGLLDALSNLLKCAK